MSAIHRPTRILALDPGTREMGFALLHGDTLVRYGVRNFKDKFESQTNQKAPGTELIEDFKPHAVVLGKLTHPERRKNSALQNLTNQIIRLALKKGIEVQEINSTDARKYLVQDRQPTKMNAAKLIVAQYPELATYLPHKGRILWTHKDKYWMNMFDALTLGIYYVRKNGNDVAQNENPKRKRR